MGRKCRSSWRTARRTAPGALDMSAAELGRKLKVPANRITEILNGQRAVTGDTALRLAHFFSAPRHEFWLNLQNNLRLAHT